MYLNDKNYRTSESFYYKQKSKQYRISNANYTASNWNSYHKDLMRTTVSDKTMFKRKMDCLLSKIWDFPSAFAYFQFDLRSRYSPGNTHANC